MRILIILFTALLAGSVAMPEQEKADSQSPEFQDYWYNHGAEISRFELEQARYGEIHKGEAVDVFVTEKMDPEHQVKADRPGPGSVPVLKLNTSRRFYTGVYPYTTMISVFSPVASFSLSLPLKMTATVHEWCGQVFMQLNLGEEAYRVESRSYFETESDRNFAAERVLPEEALWNMIRMNPSLLPQGEFRVLPGILYSRFVHKPYHSETARGTLEKFDGKSLEGNPLIKYSVSFPGSGRELGIVFESGFPHRIHSWEDRYAGLSGKTLTTRAVRTHTIQSSYWEHHRNKDRELLKALGLGTQS